jgi:peptidyl-prolyl cis-trans isomerase A (cyclophilin A)
MKVANRTFVGAAVLILALASVVVATGAANKEALMNPEALTEQAPDTYQVRFETTQGAFVIEVTRAWSPLGADRFYNLASNGFFDGVRFFRVLPGFVVQFGISGDPEIAARWREANFKDDPVVESNLKGYITYAKSSAPNSRTTQVFINLSDNTRLDGMGFAPFGKVIEGMDVVEKLYGGYGEGAPQGGGPNQGRIQAEGNSYLEENFPKLDYVKTASVAD